MKLSTCMVLAAVLLTQTTTAEAKAYKGAEVFSVQSVLYGRIEMRMRMIRGSGLVSTFFTYKNGSEMAGSTWEETDIEALGKNDARTWQSNLITGNPRMTSEQVYSPTSSLADGYHTYTLEWTPDYVSWSFDGAMVRKTEGGQASSLINAESLRFNAWASNSTPWAGALDEAALPAYQFVNWIKYYRYDSGQFVLDWTDDFDSFDTTRWAAGNWTFEGNLVDFDSANAVVQDGTLILAITKEGATGFSGTVPTDDGSGGGVMPGSHSGCTIGAAPPHGAVGLGAMLLALGLAAARRRWPRKNVVRPHALSKGRLALAVLLLAMLAPRAAAAVQSAELLRTQAYFYGRFEARVRYAPGEGVVSSFFLWRDGSSNMTSWNELDFEKIASDCRLQTNIWTGKGTQSTMINTPSFNICNDYHTYAFEWTPDYIAWFIDGTQVRRVTGASVTEYTQNASQGMSIHFNIWQGDSSFGGNLNTSTLPVYEYISWAQYSSYANGAFQLQWREEFTGSATPANWSRGSWLAPLNHSMHNIDNVKYVNGIAVFALTNDNATGYTGTPPADTASGGTSGTGGAGGAAEAGGSGAGGTMGSAGRGGTTGSAGRGGTTGGGGTGGSASARTGGSSSTGSGGRGGAGTAGNGAGGLAAGTAGNGAGGSAAGSAGNGAGGASAGATGSGAGGTVGMVGSAGSGGASGIAGASATGSGGATATGGAVGTGGNSSGGAGSPTGSDAGCGCGAAGGGLAGGRAPILLLLITACALGRRRRLANRHRR